MPGFNKNRFVDLPDFLEKHLSCGICLNIFNRSVITDCGHSFCENCIKLLIESKQYQCPECRSRFTRKRNNKTVNVVIVCNYVFTRNLKINSIIAELKTKCEFDFNGCHTVVEFGLMSTHLKECKHKFCKTCGFGAEKHGHNCLELMRADRDIWIDKYNRLAKELEQTSTELRQKTDLLRKRRISRENLRALRGLSTSSSASPQSSPVNSPILLNLTDYSVSSSPDYSSDSSTTTEYSSGWSPIIFS